VEFLATIRPVGEKFRARLLFSNSLDPVEFFRQTDHWDELAGWLVSSFEDITLVSPERFQMELDYIHLFGARWDMPTDHYLEGFFPDAAKRMSDEDIFRELDDADETLNDVMEKINAVFPSTDLEDDPRFSI
jgi:hypothetical protein